jgi:hypothetical protein
MSIVFSLKYHDRDKKTRGWSGKEKIEKKVINIILIIFVFLFCFLPNFSLAANSDVSLDQPSYFCFFDEKIDFICSKEKPVHEIAISSLRTQQIDNRIFLSTPENLNLSADDYKFLIVRAKSRVEGPYFRLNVFRRGEGVFPLEDFQPVIPLSPSFQTYYFFISNSAFWRNTVDRIVFEIEKSDLEIETIKLAKSQPHFYLKTIFQELTSLHTDDGYWINFLYIPSLNILGTPLIQYLYLFVLAVFIPLFVLKFFDQTIRKKWPIILLAIFLVFWLISEIFFLNQNIRLLKRDLNELSGRSTLEGQQVFVSRYMVFDNAPNYYRRLTADFYPFLEFLKNHLPSQSQVYAQTMHPGLSIRVFYHLVDKFIFVDQPEKADYILVYDEKLPDYQNFETYFEYPSQEKGFYKLVLIKK